jgi:hypothetical protein
LTAKRSERPILAKREPGEGAGGDASDRDDEPFVESEHAETKMAYDPTGGFTWPLRVMWLGLVVLAVWYVAAFYVPSLKAWLPWRPVVP